MRRLLLVTLVASLLAGCGAAPTGAGIAKSTAKRTTVSAPAAPLVRTIPGLKGAQPTVSMLAAALPGTSAKVVAVSQEATAQLLATDSGLDAIETLIQDGGGYLLQGWYTDLKDAIKRTWTRIKLSFKVKQALKSNLKKSFDLHEGEIDTIKDNRTAPVTTVNNLGEGSKEIVSSWKSTHNGNFEIETRRTLDEDGITQVLTVWSHGRNKAGLGVDTTRIRTLVGDDGSYKVATKQTTILKDAREEYQEWLKEVAPDGSERISGLIDHPDGNRSEITGTRDAAGKVKIEISKIAPTHNPGHH